MFYCCFTRVVAVGKWFVQLEAIAIIVSPALWAGLQMVHEKGGDCYCCFTRLEAGIQMVREIGGVCYYCFTRLVAGLQMVREIGGDCYYCFTRRWRAYKWCLKRVAIAIVVLPAFGGLTNGA
jgi:hypothetical protein